MTNYIPYSKQTISKKDIKLVNKSLHSNFLTGGKYLNILEKKFNKYVGSKYALACSSGTSAIFIAFKTLGLNEKSKVVIPAINFLASFNIADILKSKIYIADVDENTGQMTPRTLSDCIKKNKLKKIDLVITMYNGGCPLNAEEFFKLKKKYKFKILEDACHALGANYINSLKYKVGSCKFSDMCVFSLHPQKTITSGEGGIITTNKKKYYKKILIFRNHGIERKNNTKSFFHWKYIVNHSSFNFRLSEINCALAISQLNRINLFLKNRKKIAKQYEILFKKNKNIILPFEHHKFNNAWHLFFLQIKKTSVFKRDRLIQWLYRKNILTQVHYIPIFYQPKYKYLKKNGRFAGAVTFFKRTISIPIFPELSYKKVKYISKQINNYLS